MEIKKTKILEVAVILVLSAALVCMIVPVEAQRFVRIYVDQPLGYIPGVEPGETVTVDIIIEVSGIPDNDVEGIVGWRMDVAVDPSVLGIYEPPRCKGAMIGYFLNDFRMDWGYPPPTLLPGAGDPDTGYWDDITEMITPTPEGGAGEGYSGLKLVTLEFYSKSETAYSLVNLINIEYYTANGVWHPVDEVIDGNYNPPEVPEFPLGATLEILFIPVIVYMLWRSKQRKRLTF